MTSCNAAFAPPPLKTRISSAVARVAVIDRADANKSAAVERPLMPNPVHEDNSAPFFWGKIALNSLSTGAGEGIRTLDPDLGKFKHRVFYMLSLPFLAG